MPPVLYYDLGSPYAYLAASRIERVLGSRARLQPVLAGAIFAHRGWGSWADTREQERNVAEIERRAAAHGLPPVCWPPGWPNNTLGAMRMAVWADQQGVGGAFARAGFAAAFARGRDLSDQSALLEVAEQVGLAGKGAALALASPAIKSALREATDRAIARGVKGVPTTFVDGQIFYGDDRLDLAAAAVAG